MARATPKKHDATAKVGHEAKLWLSTELVLTDCSLLPNQYGEGDTRRLDNPNYRNTAYGTSN